MGGIGVQRHYCRPCCEPPLHRLRCSDTQPLTHPPTQGPNPKSIFQIKSLRQSQIKSFQDSGADTTTYGWDDNIEFIHKLQTPWLSVLKRTITTKRPRWRGKLVPTFADRGRGVLHGQPAKRISTVLNLGPLDLEPLLFQVAPQFSWWG
jgi:hypothetical protein